MSSVFQSQYRPLTTRVQRVSDANVSAQIRPCVFARLRNCAQVRLSTGSSPPMYAPVLVLCLRHFAWCCHDSEETCCFDEYLLGLPLAHFVKSTIVSSAGGYCLYDHGPASETGCHRYQSRCLHGKPVGSKNISIMNPSRPCHTCQQFYAALSAVSGTMRESSTTRSPIMRGTLH